MADATLRQHSDLGALTLDLGGAPLAILGMPAVETDRALVDAPGVAGDDRIDADVDGLHLEWSVRRVGDGPVWECALVATATSDVTITRGDSLALLLDGKDRGEQWTVHSYKSAWGDEFRPEGPGTTRHDTVLEVRSGRSGHGAVPWAGVVRENGPGALIITPAWSGNWHIRVASDGRIAAGVSPWEFSVALKVGERLAAPTVVIAVGEDLDEAGAALQVAVRDHWMPRTPWTDALPVEWNHWWPYEDAEVNEGIIAANADVAARVGIEVATVDAGWFGDSDASSDWQEQRGDWDRVNLERFPSGLEALGDRIREAGLSAGMWIEAEAVGRSARVRSSRPDMLARSVERKRHDPSYGLMTVSLDASDPSFLGYVCMGSADGRDHVLTSMCRLVTETGARWIKLDFNVDPDSGCTRTDHGHGAGDGLLRHYEGLYAVLDEFRTRHPEVLLESCSSGGLRIDLGLARHVHGFFLSDPDYTEHHLEVLFGVSRLLPPAGILHWSQSQWRGENPPQQLDWSALAPDAFDTMLRAAVLHRFGVSIRLIELREDLLDRLATHVALYKTAIAPLVRDGVLHPLTAPPIRGGLGERRPAIQLSAGNRHLVAVFALDGESTPGASEPVVPWGITDGEWTVTDLADGTVTTRRGADLHASGLALPHHAGATSWLVLIERLD